MGKHCMPKAPRRVPTSMLAAATAAGAICIAFASAGTANAKTHHGFGAPGNPYGGSSSASMEMSGPYPMRNGYRSSVTSYSIHSTGTGHTSTVSTQTQGGSKAGGTGTGGTTGTTGTTGTAGTKTGTGATGLGAGTGGTGTGAGSAGTTAGAGTGSSNPDHTGTGSGGSSGGSPKGH